MALYGSTPYEKKYDNSQNSLKVRDNIFYDFVKFIPPYFILGGLFHLFMGEIL